MHFLRFNDCEYSTGQMIVNFGECQYMGGRQLLWTTQSEANLCPAHLATVQYPGPDTAQEPETEARAHPLCRTYSVC